MPPGGDEEKGLVVEGGGGVGAGEGGGKCGGDNEEAGAVVAGRKWESPLPEGAARGVAYGMVNGIMLAPDMVSSCWGKNRLLRCLVCLLIFADWHCSFLGMFLMLTSFDVFCYPARILERCGEALLSPVYSCLPSKSRPPPPRPRRPLPVSSKGELRRDDITPHLPR